MRLNIDDFRDHVNKVLGYFLRRKGFIENSYIDGADSQNLFFESNSSKLNIYNSIRNGEINLLIGTLNSSNIAEEEASELDNWFFILKVAPPLVMPTRKELLAGVSIAPQSIDQQLTRLLKLLEDNFDRALANLSQLANKNRVAEAGVKGGEPCPKDGYWFTPADMKSRRFFHQGENMPIVKSDYGLTFWQRDADQTTVQFK